MEKEHAELNESEERRRLAFKRQPEALGIVAVEKGPGGRQLEHIGHMLVSAEPKPKRMEKQRIDTLNRSQLLELSEKIKIDGSSLRQIYETHLIGERGLRHLVAEYMHDGDLKQVLRQEVMERERDFERDPAIRHILDEDETDLSELPKSSLEALLAKAELSSEQRGEETAFFKARARFEAEELQQHKQSRQIIDISLAVIIAILLLLVILLFLRRS